MKRIFILTLLLLTTYFSFSQTIVSTSPENKNVILEEFTGIYCVNCPDGHAIAQSLMDANPDDFFAINIHTGGYANPSGSDPDFRTPFGAALASQSQLWGYPAGTVNRRNFPGYEQSGSPSGATAQSRGSWGTTSATVLGEVSYVNLAVEAELDIVTKELTVHVEAYYTGNSPEPTNLLNVALLQDNTLGPQTGGGAGNNYVHMHRLVHLLTGQWGEVIPTTTTGTFVDETFTYTIPADYNGVSTEILDMKVVAFISETHQEIPTGSGCLPILTNLNFDDDAGIDEVLTIDDQCYTSTTINPQVIVTNYGQNTVTSLNFEYSVNAGTVETHTWTGSLESLRHETIDLPAVSFDLEETNSLDVTITNTDENAVNNTGSTAFNKVPTATSNSFTLTINTDNNGDELYWRVRDSGGNLIELNGFYANNQTFTETFDLPNDECYEFEVIDTGDDGGCTLELVDDDSIIAYYTDGDHGSGERKNFAVTFGIGVEEHHFVDSQIFPNPANTVINIKNAAGLQIKVIDILGRSLLSKENISSSEQIDVSSLAKGTYMVQLSDGINQRTEKVVISR